MGASLPYVAVGEHLFGMVMRTPVPKVVGEDVIPSPEMQTLHEREQDAVSQLEVALRLVLPTIINIGGSYSTTYQYVPLGRMVQFQGRPGAGRVIFNNTTITASDAAELQEIWSQLSRYTSAKLTVALRRFGSAATRSNVEDRLIDVMIGAEALFLAPEDPKGSIEAIRRPRA